MWKIHNPFRFLTIAVFCMLAVTLLVQQGMFMDGLMYSSISRNLAEGQGSMWFPHFSSTLLSDFHEHPPLAFWMQALFFKVLGDGFWTERIYCLIAGMLVAWLIVLSWKTLNTGNSESQKFAWLPVLFWLSVPVVSWGIGNNMLENTMAIFTSAAVLFVLKGIRASRYRLIFFTVAAFMVFLGVLTKGPVALFPLASLMIYWVVYRQTGFWKALLQSLFITGLLVMCFVLLFLLSHDAWISMNLYVEQQIIKAYQGSPTVGSRFFIIARMAQELVIALSLLFLILAIYLFRKRTASGLNKEVMKKAGFLLLTGISASLPVMVSMKQSGFYVIPSYPFFALAFAFLCLPALQTFFRRLAPAGLPVKILNITGLLLLAGSLVYNVTQAGKPGRDIAKLHDLDVIGAVIPQHSVIGITESIYQDWAMHGYCQRYYRISLDNDQHAHHDWFLTLTGESCPLPAYVESGRELQMFRLYKASADRNYAVITKSKKMNNQIF